MNTADGQAQCFDGFTGECVSERGDGHGKVSDASGHGDQTGDAVVGYAVGEAGVGQDGVEVGPVSGTDAGQCEGVGHRVSGSSGDCDVKYQTFTFVDSVITNNTCRTGFDACDGGCG